MKIKILSHIVLALTVISCNSEISHPTYEAISVIPLPDSIITAGGDFILSASTKVKYDSENRSIAETVDIFNKYLLQMSDIQIQNAGKGDESSAITVTLSDSITNPEGYRLTVDKNSISIEAGSEKGVFYAFQTLIQIIFPGSRKISKGKITVPCVSVIDDPQYTWRGIHLDVSRHFFPKEFIFKLLDAMAMHKLNTFHWHLTDDQGWRIEILKYPELTSKGAWRDETLIGHGSETPWKYDGIRYGGFYTQQDVRDVVEYASKLHINVLPEIEMPGHAVAALISYPGLSCNGIQVPPFNRWGVSGDVFCAGKEETFSFLEGVLSEVCELFPYEYIHIGGDECPKVKWQECPDCQKRIADNDLKDESELQSYFVKRIAAFLESKGKKIIGWDEILEGGIAESAAVMSWRGSAGGIEAANKGHDVVMTPHSFVYLDYYQSPYNEPLSIGGMLDLKKVYSLPVMPEEITADMRRHIIGAQANIWTEYMPDSRHVEYMVFPRIAALAEVLWSDPADLDYENFKLRMNEQYARYDAMGINYRVPYPEGLKPDNIFPEKSVTVTLDNGISSSAIFYTIDGSMPDEKSPRYIAPFTVDLEQERQLKTVTVMPSGKRSEVMTGILRQADFKDPVVSDEPTKGLIYRLFIGEFSTALSLPDIADTSGVLDIFRIPAGAPLTLFGLELSGLINIQTDGIYTFFCTNDDGLILYIDDEMIVNGDLYHHGVVNEGSAALKAGMHEIKATFFQQLYRQGLNVSYEGPGVERKTIPEGVLFHLP